MTAKTICAILLPALVFLVVVIGISAKLVAVDGAGNNEVDTIQPESYRDFLDNAEAGFLQILQIPYQTSMDKLDSFDYLVVRRDKPFLTNPQGIPYVRRYATTGLATDARTGYGCLEIMPYLDGDRSNEAYGLPVCLSDNDLSWLNLYGARYWAFSSY